MFISSSTIVRGFNIDIEKFQKLPSVRADFIKFSNSLDKDYKTEGYEGYCSAQPEDIFNDWWSEYTLNFEIKFTYEGTEFTIARGYQNKAGGREDIVVGLEMYKTFHSWSGSDGRYCRCYCNNDMYSIIKQPDDLILDRLRHHPAYGELIYGSLVNHLLHADWDNHNCDK